MIFVTFSGSMPGPSILNLEFQAGSVEFFVRMFPFAS